ncbi:MAG: hypothetical protein U0163_17985 [Gemmatimonadaceae bacterium]
MGEFGRSGCSTTGVEIGLDPRTGGIMDLSTIEMWQLEGRIERGANGRASTSGAGVPESATPRPGSISVRVTREYLSRLFRSPVLVADEALQLGAQQLGA